MITVILFVSLALLTGSFLALLQGYLKLNKELKELKERDFVREINETSQKVKGLKPK